MKTARIVFIILGWLFMFFQLVSYISPLAKHEPLFNETDIPYILGRNFFALLGALFLLIARKQKIRTRIKEEKKQLNSFLREQ